MWNPEKLTELLFPNCVAIVLDLMVDLLLHSATSQGLASWLTRPQEFNLIFFCCFCLTAMCKMLSLILKSSNTEAKVGCVGGSVRQSLNLKRETWWTSTGAVPFFQNDRALLDAKAEHTNPQTNTQQTNWPAHHELDILNKALTCRHMCSSAPTKQQPRHHCMVADTKRTCSSFVSIWYILKSIKNILEFP